MPTTKDNTTNGALVPVATTSHSALATSHLAPAPDTDRAGRVAYYHQLSREAGRVSIMAAVAAGVELHRAKLECNTGMFQAWIKRNCEFGYATANRYMNLAESLVCGDGLAELLEDAEPPRVEVLEEYVRPIEARTLTQLYFDLGICKPGKVGGARPGAGRPAQTRDAVRDAGAAWGACGLEIDKAMAWGFTSFLPEAMAREAYETVTLLRDALRERLDELKKGGLR